MNTKIIRGSTQIVIIVRKYQKLHKAFHADFVNFESIISVLKATDGLISEHTSHVMNYLKAINYK
jgi:hypothetical protein